MTSYDLSISEISGEMSFLKMMFKRMMFRMHPLFHSEATFLLQIIRKHIKCVYVCFTVLLETIIYTLTSLAGGATVSKYSQDLYNNQVYIFALSILSLCVLRKCVYHYMKWKKCLGNIISAKHINCIQAVKTIRSLTLFATQWKWSFWHSYKEYFGNSLLYIKLNQFL